MDLMRPADAHQVTVIAFKRFKAVVDKPVVKNKINDAIYADAGTNPKVVI